MLTVDNQTYLDY